VPDVPAPPTNSTKSESATPSLYQYLCETPDMINLTSIDWNRIAGVMDVFAAVNARASDDPVYGPDHESTGTGFTG
jgi:hypothetical protein